MEKIKGKVIILGDDVDTDQILPGYAMSEPYEEIGKYAMAGLPTEDFKLNREPGCILVAGRNFGCGSSREHAPIAILGAGMPVVIGHSFARIFYRNAFNQGLLLFEIGDGVDKIKDGDQVEIDSDRGIITDKTNGSTFTCPPLSKTISAIVEKGGLVNYVKSRLLAQAK